MATTSSRRTPSAGGKIVKKRRVARSPYARPSSSTTPPPRSDDPENPNWLSGLIYPVKAIASGAGKIISFFGNDYSSSSSSDASDSSDNDDDDDEIQNESFQEDDRFDKLLSMSSKSDTKRAIEQLVTQETYSRREANELIKLVRSRIMDTNGTSGETTPNVRSTAIMEARKWLQDKRSGSKKKLDDELDVSNMASPSQISRNEKGSPVDMARSYMQNRPAWASPSLKQADVGFPSPLGTLHFKDETPKSTFRSSEAKKSSFTSGSWNLLDEIRRVRSKATEELLAAAPLTKTIFSSLSPERNPPQDSLVNKGDAEGAAGRAESTRDRQDNILPDAAASTPSRVSQDGDAVLSVEPQESQEGAELKNNSINEVKQSITAENGFGCSASGLPEGQDTHEAQPYEEENGNLIESSQGGRDIHMEENAKPQEKAATDVVTDTVINGSQNSSSMQQEEQLQDFSQPVAEDGLAPKVKDAQKERKSRGYTRRGRGRGK